MGLQTDGMVRCILTYIVPCHQFASNADRADTMGYTCAFVAFFIPFLDQYIGARTRMDTREKAGIEGSFLCDLLIFTVCPCCAIIQTDAELDNMDMGAEIERV